MLTVVHVYDFSNLSGVGWSLLNLTQTLAVSMHSEILEVNANSKLRREEPGKHEISLTVHGFKHCRNCKLFRYIIDDEQMSIFM